jgi:hypothetical protein
MDVGERDLIAGAPLVPNRHTPPPAKPGESTGASTRPAGERRRAPAGARRQPPFPGVTTLTESRLTEDDAHPVDL